MEGIIFQPEANSPSARTMTSKGTLEEWKENLIPLVKGRPYLITFLCAAFAGPLLKPTLHDSFGLHLFGRSTSGKTTAIQVAASVWGNATDPQAAPRASFVQTWHTTTNALEAICAAHNDTLLCLDEIGKCEDKNFKNTIYNVFGGTGKQAMNTDRNLKAMRTWRIVAVSSGEISSKSKLEESGATVRAGQQIRLMDIPIIGSIVDNASEATKLKHACSNFHGTAGTEFIKRLIVKYPTFDALTILFREALDHEAKKMPKGDSQEKERAMKHFALLKVAGVSAKTLLGLDIEYEEISSAVDTVATAWLNNSGDLTEDERAVNQVLAFISQHKHQRFKWINTDKSNNPVNMCGYWQKSTNRYFFTESGFEEACKGFEKRDVLRALKSRGILVCRDKDHYDYQFPAAALHDTGGKAFCVQGLTQDDNEVSASD